jgi:hypothetical protein
MRSQKNTHQKWPNSRAPERGCKNSCHCERSEAIFHCLIRYHWHKESYETIDVVLLFHGFENKEDRFVPRDDS